MFLMGPFVCTEVYHKSRCLHWAGRGRGAKSTCMLERSDKARIIRVWHQHRGRLCPCRNWAS
jgi:hypothetical protein